MDKDFLKFAVKNCTGLVISSFATGISLAASQKAQKKGNTLTSGLLKGVAISSAVLAWISASQLRNAVVPTIVIPVSPKELMK